MQSIGTNSVSGLVSGLDTANIVESLIALDRAPARFLESRVAETTNKLTSYKAVEAKFLALQSSLGVLSKSDTFSKMSFSVSDDTAVSVKGSGDTTPGTFDMRVLALARNHQIAANGVSDPDAAVLGTGTIQIGVGDATQTVITVDSSNNSLTGLKDAINSAGAGVTASIINDGTSKNANRLILTANDTGLSNTINITDSLTGGVTLDFANPSFDVPETDGFSTLATSAVSLGSTAGYTGTANKSYTFTVQGAGAQTVGTDIITIDWTDGTDSGSIVVTQADTEVTLAGAGSDGLTLAFSAGDLIGGDTFTVQSFAPTLQKPQDAQISVGSSASGGAPIVISSDSNTFSSAIPGMSITVQKVSLANEVITIGAELDVAGIRSDIQAFIDSYNDAMKFIDEQFSFDPEKKEGGSLISESLLRVMQESVRSAATGIVKDGGSKFNTLATIGIRTDANGLLRVADSSRLDSALNDSIDDVRRLFVKDITTDSSGISFLTAPDDIQDGRDYLVDITQAATRGTFTGNSMPDLSVTPLVIDSTNNTIKIKVDGRVSDDLVLTQGSYTSFDQLTREIQKRIDADAQIGALGVEISYTSGGGTGELILTSGSYGSGSVIELDSGSNYVQGHAALGLTGGVSAAGLDVAGTINGELATGSGQTLTGDEGNETTAGLALKITFTAAEITSGSEGTFRFVRGVSARVKDTLFRITDSSAGSLPRRTKAFDAQIEDFKAQIKLIDERLQLKRRRLLEKFNAMEEVLGQLNAQGSFLSNGLASLSSNFGS